MIFDKHLKSAWSFIFTECIIFVERRLTFVITGNWNISLIFSRGSFFHHHVFGFFVINFIWLIDFWTDNRILVAALSAPLTLTLIESGWNIYGWIAVNWVSKPCWAFDWTSQLKLIQLRGLSFGSENISALCDYIFKYFRPIDSVIEVFNEHSF